MGITMILKILLGVLFLFPVNAYARIDYAIDLEIGKRSIEENLFKYRASISAGNKHKCLYLPFNDPDYFQSANQKIDDSNQKVVRTLLADGYLNTDLDESKVVKLNKWMYRISTNDKLNFEGEFEIPKMQEWDHKINMSDFHPKIIADCEESTANYSFLAVDFKVKIDNKSKLDLVTSSKKEGRFYKIKSRLFPLYLVSGMKKDQKKINGVEVEIYYDSKYMGEVFQNISKILPRQLKLVDKWPYPKLILMQTNILQKPFVPGIVTLNLPRQPPMQKIQLEYLNLGNWQLSVLVAEQIWGADISHRDENDIWFFQGISEYISHRSVYNDPDLNDLVRLKILGYQPLP